jgi:hypothetical protein
LNGDESFRSGFAPFLTDCRMIPFNDLETLEGELRKGDVAGFVVEPAGQGREPSVARLSAAPSRFAANTARCSLTTKCRRAWAARTLPAIEHDGPDVHPDTSCSRNRFRRIRAGGRGAVEEMDSRKVLEQQRQWSIRPRSAGQLRDGGGLAALDVIDREGSSARRTLRQPHWRRIAG